MKTVTEKEVCADLARVADEVCLTHDPVLIACADGRSLVLLALEDYQSRNDTEYLLSNPVNAARLMESLADFQTQRGYQEHELIEP